MDTMRAALSQACYYPDRAMRAARAGLALYLGVDENCVLPTAGGAAGSMQYKKYNGVCDCIVKIVQKRGLPGLYRGICANYMKAIPAISIKYMSGC